MSEKYKTYTCSYNFDGERWRIDVKALNFTDATARLAVIGQYGKVDGEVVMTFPVKGSLGDILARMVVAVRNFFRGRQP